MILYDIIRAEPRETTELTFANSTNAIVTIQQHSYEKSYDFAVFKCGRDESDEYDEKTIN